MVYCESIFDVCHEYMPSNRDIDILYVIKSSWAQTSIKSAEKSK